MKLIVVLILAASAAACAGAVTGVCAVQPIGENEAGVQFFRYHCEPQE